MIRWEPINMLIKKYDLKSYLEIGVFRSHTFGEVKCDLKHSVDPNYPATFEMTSDKFFERDNREYDIVFVDGLHTADQTYRDIDNSYRQLNPKFIVVHDVNPITEWHARPQDQVKKGEVWNGTSYLGYIKFCMEHPDLHKLTINSDNGIGIICTTPPNIDWAYFEKNREYLLNLKSIKEFKTW